MDLIPVDLNAILFAVERQLHDFALILDKPTLAQQYAANATARMVAIDAILWNATGSQWQDYHVDRKQWKQEVMVSNFIPLWTKCYDRSASTRNAQRFAAAACCLFVLMFCVCDCIFSLLLVCRSLMDEGSVVSALLQSGLIMEGGVVTTLNNNTQQWDFPNAWAPLQWMLVEGIASARYESTSTRDNFKIYNSSALKPDAPPQPASSCDIIRPETWFNCSAASNTAGGDGGCRWCFPPGTDISDAIGQRWLLTNFLHYNSTGFMLEKYFAPKLGGAGAGGEYSLQKGFGWTNGVCHISNSAQETQR